MTERCEDPKYDKILRALLETEEMSFEQVVNVVHNRNAARERLQKLVKRNFVKDLRTQPGHGKTARYVLTSGGQKRALTSLLADIGKSLSQLNGLVSCLKEPRQASRLRKWLHEKDETSIQDSERDLEALRNGSLKLEEVLSKHQDRTRESEGLLTGALRDLQRLTIQVLLPGMKDRTYFVGFPKNAYGGLVLIDQDMYEKWMHEAELWRKQQKA